MSFLDEIAKKKTSLRPTTTVVTTPLGVQYIEPKSDDNDEVFSTGVKTVGKPHHRPPNLILCRPPSCGYIIDEKPDLQIGVITDHLLLGTVSCGGGGGVIRTLYYFVTCRLASSMLP